MPVKTDFYPSRDDNEPTLLLRKDPVVYSTYDGSGPLNLSELQFYEKNGYLFLEKFFSKKDVQKMTNALSLLWKKHKNSTKEEVIREPEGVEIRSIFAIHESDAFFMSLAHDRRIVSVMRQLLGSDVYIHQSRINLKSGFKGKEFYWHSDFETWHVEDGMPRMRAISCSIALTENTPFNGPLMVIPGSHRHFVSCVGRTPENHFIQSLRGQEYGVPNPDSLQWLYSQGGIEAPTGAAGSILLFDCNLMHGCNSNISPLPRSNVFLVYNSIENRLQSPYSGMPPRPEYIASRK